MKLVDRDGLKRHLDYLIQKERQLAHECALSPDNEFEKGRRYCFEANALAYGLCENVMDYYLVADTQVVGQWISVKDRLPKCIHGSSDSVLVHRDNGECEVAYLVYDDDDGFYWYTQDERTGFEFEEVTHWMLLPESPKDGDAK